MWNGLSGLFLKLELGNVYNSLNYSMPTNDVSNVTGVRTTMNVLRLPLEPSGASRPASTNTNNTVSKLGPSDYRGNMAAGFNAGYAILHGGDDRPDQYPGLERHAAPRGLRQRPDLPELAGQPRRRHRRQPNTVLMGETLTGTWAEASSCCVRTTIDRQVNKPIQIDGVNYYTYWMSKHPGSSTSSSATAASRP